MHTHNYKANTIRYSRWNTVVGPVSLDLKNTIYKKNTKCYVNQVYFFNIISYMPWVCIRQWWLQWMKDSSMARKGRNIGRHGIHWWHEYHGCQHDGFTVSSMARKGRNIGSHGIHWWHEYHGCQHDDFTVSVIKHRRESGLLTWVVERSAAKLTDLDQHRDWQGELA